jgi:hypothetical protein
MSVCTCIRSLLNHATDGDFFVLKRLVECGGAAYALGRSMRHDNVHSTAYQTTKCIDKYWHYHVIL